MKKMKVLGREQGIMYYPDGVPMEMLSEFMAQKNHSQTLDGLNSRGGLGVNEILANLKSEAIGGKETQKDVDELNRLIKKHQSSLMKTQIINFTLEAITRRDELAETVDTTPVFQFEDKWLTIDELYDEFFNQ